MEDEYLEPAYGYRENWRGERVPYRADVWAAWKAGHLYRLVIKQGELVDVWRFCGPTGRYRKVARFRLTGNYPDSGRYIADQALHNALAQGA